MDQTIRDHFHLLCRLCGRTVLKSIKIRQQNQTNDEATLTEKIYDCIGIQVNDIDQLPQQICHTCFDKINDYFEFRMLCELTNVELRKLKKCIKNGQSNTNHIDDDFEDKNEHQLTADSDDDSDYCPIENNSNDYEPNNIKIETDNFSETEQDDSLLIPTTSKRTKRSRSPISSNSSKPLNKSDETNKNNKKIQKFENKLTSGEDDDLKYEFINGTRIDSQILYIPYEGQLYRRNSKYGNEYRYRCRVKNCGSSISYHATTKKVFKRSQLKHNHGPRHDEYRRLLVETEIKEAVINSLDVDIQTIYNDIVSKSNVPDIPELKSIRRNLYRIRTEALYKQQMCREERI